MAKPTPTALDIIKALKAKDKKEFGSLVVVSESKTSTVTEWISTGSYALNKIISGDPRKGIPAGLITALAGETSTGKTFICANVAREAQKLGYIVIYVETENSPIGDVLKNMGADPDNIVKPEGCFTIAAVKNNLVKTLRAIHEEYPESKILVILDSLGNLVSDKQLYGDIEDNKIGHDQGMKAKELKALSAILTQELGRCNGTMLVANHVYLKPGANPSMPPEEVFSGGSGFLYTASVIVYMHKRTEKEEEENLATGKKENRAVGIILRGMTKKNRIIPEGKKGEFHVSFRTGMNKWYGLLEEALIHGFFVEGGAGYYEVKHLGKKVRIGELYKDEVWLPIFDELCNKIAETTAYSSAADDALESVLENTKETKTVESEEKEEKKRGRPAKK